MDNIYALYLVCINSKLICLTKQRDFSHLCKKITKVSVALVGYKALPMDGIYVYLFFYL